MHCGQSFSAYGKLLSLDQFTVPFSALSAHRCHKTGPSSQFSRNKITEPKVF